LSARPSDQMTTNLYEGRMLPQDVNVQTGNSFVRVGMAPEMLLMTLKKFLGNDLDRFVPGGAAAVDKKLKEMNGGRDIGIEQSRSLKNFEDSISNSSTDAAREAITQAPPEIKEQ